MWQRVLFVLIVDDFSIQYTGKDHAQHLLDALRKSYVVTTNWSGTKFAGINIKWDCTNRTCQTGMASYINNVCNGYSHPTPAKPVHSPHKHRKIAYGAKEQFTCTTINTIPPLDNRGITQVQGIIGSLLYYAWAVDNKLLATLSAIGYQQASAMEDTLVAVNQLLDYVATYPNNSITYQTSNMILDAHSDASFLSEPHARSRIRSHIFVSKDDPIPRTNRPIFSISKSPKVLYASAAEAKLGGLYVTAKEMVPLRNTLIEMGWP
jgi:hypothetical protein